MKTITIRRCPVCAEIKAHTDAVAATLQNEGFNVRIEDGNRGEFSVWLDNQELARNLLDLPSAESILGSVHHAEEAVVS